MLLSKFPDEPPEPLTTADVATADSMANVTTADVLELGLWLGYGLRYGLGYGSGQGSPIYGPRANYGPF